MSSRWHSVEEVSAHLGVVPDTLYRWIAAGRIPAHRVGRHWRFQLAEIDEWVREGAASDTHAPASRRRSGSARVARTAARR